LAGATLALRFKVLALLPTTVFLLAVVGIGLVIRGDTIWWICVMMLAAAASLQLGYFGTSLLRIMLARNDRWAPLSGDRQTHCEAPPLAPPQPNRDIVMEGGRSEEDFPTDRGAPDQSVDPRPDPARQK